MVTDKQILVTQLATTLQALLSDQSSKVAMELQANLKLQVGLIICPKHMVQELALPSLVQ